MHKYIVEYKDKKKEVEATTPLSAAKKAVRSDGYHLEEMDDGPITVYVKVGFVDNG